MKLFESCDLDPDEPRRQANAEWKRALSNLPKDTLSWHILDKVERAMNNARELRKETGALDEFDPEHLREELENIREAIPRGSKFHRVIYGDKNVAIDAYATFMAQIEWEKKNHPSPGKVPADAVDCSRVESHTRTLCQWRCLGVWAKQPRTAWARILFR